MTKKDKSTLILLDANALIHRAFHALPPLKTKTGLPSGAVYGFALTLMGVLEKQKPDYLMAAFDLKGPTFRHDKFKDYKANRKKAPDELYEQIPIVKEMLQDFGVPVYEKAGFEADDIIGTITKDKEINGEIDRLVVTGDMDVLQLVDDQTKVYMLRKGIKDTVIYDAKGVKKRYDLTPQQIIDYKALRGDPSDNIPGVKGVGEKTALNLLGEYKTLDGVYENLEKVSSKSVKNKLEIDKKNAFLSYDLATIKTDIDDLGFDLGACTTDDLDNSALADFFRKMGFRSLFNRVAEDGEKFDDSEKFEKKEIKISILDSEAKVEKVIKEIKKAKKFAFTTYDSGNGVYQSKLQGLGICIEPWKTFFVPLECRDAPLVRPDERRDMPWRVLKDIFEDNEIVKIGYDIKNDLELLWKFFVCRDRFETCLYGFRNKNSGKYNNFYDVQIAAYLLSRGQATNFEKLILKEFDAELEHSDKKSGQVSLLSGTDNEKQKCTAEKANWILKLHGEYETALNKMTKDQQRKKQVKKDVLWLHKKLESPLKNILAKMELFGVKVESEKLNKISAKAQAEISKLEKEIHKLAGEEFNVNSSAQLAPILYEKLKIPTADIKRGKTGLSTDADQLRKIHDKHPIVPLIEKYREFFKLKSTYTDALPKLIEEDGRIHARFNQAVTATGRLSSSDPNLQNIPKRGEWADLIREAFVAEKGWVLVSADYSQIDLRVAAHLSGDERMIKAFKEGKDIHRATAAWVNRIAEEEVTKEQRSAAKSLNFGILYGMGIYGFMRDSGLSMESAKIFIDGYKKAFAGLQQFIEDTKQFARENDYVETELGRRRYIQNMSASNQFLRSAAERMAINLPVQGLSADIMKLAMVAVENKLLQKVNKKELQAKMVLQIHDEMIFEVKEEIADEFMNELKKIMESVYELKVPLTVGVNKGSNWQEL